MIPVLRFALPIVIRIFPFLETVAARGLVNGRDPRRRSGRDLVSKNGNILIAYKLEAKSDCLEAVSLEGSATDKTTVDIWASEKFLSVCRVA